jgi:hypothetical protein
MEDRSVGTTSNLERQDAPGQTDAGEREESDPSSTGGRSRRLSRARRNLIVGAAAIAAGAVLVVVQNHGASTQPGGSGRAATPGASSSSVPSRPADPSRDPATASTMRTVGGLDVRTSTYGRLNTTRRTLRVVSAPGDLTGKLELAWASDGGRAVGDGHCTQTFRFSPSLPVGQRPTMMLCWRTSPRRSVYTLLVDLAQTPSAQASVAVIDRVWASAG